MEKEKNLIGVAAVSFVLGMLVAFVSVVVAVVVTRPCPMHAGFDRPPMEMGMPGRKFDKYKAHEAAKSFERRAAREMQQGKMPRAPHKARPLPVEEPTAAK